MTTTQTEPALSAERLAEVLDQAREGGWDSRKSLRDSEVLSVVSELTRLRASTPSVLSGEGLEVLRKLSEKAAQGKWVVGPADDTVVTHMGADGLRYEVASIDGDYNQPETWPVMEANARLIAGAVNFVRFLLATGDRP